MSNIYNLTVECNFDQEELVNILSGATYGSDWLEIYATKEERKKVKISETDCREDVWAKILLAGGTIQAVDHEDDDEKEYALSLDDIKEAFTILGKECRSALMSIIDDGGMNADYYDYNNLLQCAMFKEIVYG
jgi:hypothetical protein